MCLISSGRSPAVTPEPNVEPQQKNLWLTVAAPLLTGVVFIVIVSVAICGVLFYWRGRKKTPENGSSVGDNSNVNIPLLTSTASGGTSSQAFASQPISKGASPSPQPPSEQISVSPDSKTSDSSSVAEKDVPHNVSDAVASQYVNPGVLEPVDVGPTDSPHTPPSPSCEQSHYSQGEAALPPSLPRTHSHPNDTPSSLAQTSYEHSHLNGEALGSGSDSAGNRSTCQERMSEGATAPGSISTPCDSDDEQPKPKPVQQATPGRESEPLSSAGRDEPISRSLEQLVTQDDSAPMENGFQTEGSVDSYEPRPKPVSSCPDSLHWAPREAPGPGSRNPGALDPVSSPPAHHISGSPPVGVGALHSPSQDPSPAAAAAFYGEESQHVIPQASSSNAGNAETVMGYFPLRLPHQQQQPPSEKDPQTRQPKREDT